MTSLTSESFQVLAATWVLQDEVATHLLLDGACLDSDVQQCQFTLSQFFDLEKVERGGENAKRIQLRLRSNVHIPIPNSCLSRYPCVQCQLSNLFGTLFCYEANTKCREKLGNIEALFRHCVQDALCPASFLPALVNLPVPAFCP